MQEYKILSDNNVLIIYEGGRLYMDFILEGIMYQWLDIIDDEKKLQLYIINAIYAIRRTIKQHFERKK